MSTRIALDDDIGFVEKDCAVKIQGRSFTMNGAYLMLDKKTGLYFGLLYASHDETGQPRIGSWDSTWSFPMICGKTWRSNMGDGRMAIKAQLCGRAFHGTWFTDSSIVRVKESKS